MVKYFRVLSLVFGFLIAGWLLYTLTVKKLENLRVSSNSYSSTLVTAKEREKQLDCLALNIYREAANEPFEGKVGVAQVTLNRVEHPAFPKDVCAVVYQKTKFVEKVVCQFSWYCDSTHRNRPIHRELYDESYVVAQKVLLENFRLPSLNEALYYHADYVNPRWNLEKVVKLGRHIFYKPHTKGDKNV